MLKLNKKAAGKTTVREYNSDFFFFFLLIVKITSQTLNLNSQHSYLVSWIWMPYSPMSLTKSKPFPVQ